jgi:type I restriction enzyme S subunit
MSNQPLPDGWKISPLSDICSVVSGGTPSRDIAEYWHPPEIDWVTPTDITRGESRVLFSAKEKISKKGLSASSAKLLPVNTVLMTSRATLGEIKVAAVECCTNQGFKSLVVKEGTDPWFLYYQMKRKKPEYEGFGIGSTFLEVNKKDTDRFLVEVAPYREQQKIAHILTTVDNLIEKTQALIDKYTAVKQGMMHDLFTRGIDLATGQLRPSYEQAPELYKETELGWVPREWGVKPLQMYSEKIWIGLVTTMTTNYVKNGVKLLRNQDIKENEFKKEGLINLDKSFADQYNSRKFKFGDIATVHTGDVGTSAVIDGDLDGAHGFATLNTRLDHSKYLNFYFSRYFNSSHFKIQVEGVVTGDGRSNLNLKDFVNLLVPVPVELDEQIEIHNRLNAVETLINSNKELNKKYRIQKAGLMQDLLTGRVRVDCS